MKNVIRKKLWCLMLGLFLISLSQDVNAQTETTSPLVQEIAATHDLTIYAPGTFSSDATITTLEAEGQDAVSKAEIVYYEAVSSDIQINGTSPEAALISNLRFIGEYESSSAAIKDLYNNTVSMLQ